MRYFLLRTFHGTLAKETFFGNWLILQMLNERSQADEVHPVKSFRSSSGSLMFPTRTNSICLCEPPGVFQETGDFLETGSKTLSFSITTPSHKKSHYTWRTDCVLVRTTFFPDRYVLRFGEVFLWTGHREKFPAALKIEKTPLLLWVRPHPLTAPVK